MASFSRFITFFFLTASVVADIFPVNVPSGFFPGPQSGIGSWFRASNSADATNGKSWCAYTYYDSDPIFAVSLKAMGGHTYSSDPSGWKEDTQKHCGLEAKVTDPTTGKTMLMYIGDAFDDNWIPKGYPESLDIMLSPFTALHGNPNGNKNTVINPVHWELTGRVNTKYAAAGASWPSAAALVAKSSPTSPEAAALPSTFTTAIAPTPA